jgi:phosphomannomutase
MDYTKIYSDFLKKRLNPQKKIKAVFDCSNGAAGPIVKKLKITARPQKDKAKYGTQRNLNLNIINEIPDGNFPGHGPDPWARGAMDQLKKEVLRQKADLGAIFDADGDRVFFIDNLGRSVEPDIVARLLIWHLKPRRAVCDIRTGWLVKKNGVENLKLRISRVGHFYIKKLMRGINADLGVEKSGHYYFALRNHNKEKVYYDSGILAAIEIINAVSCLPYSLADFSNLLPQHHRSGEINIKIQPRLCVGAPTKTSENGKIKFKNLLRGIEKHFKSKAVSQKLKTISHLDGLTMEFSSWWFN